MDKNQGSKTSVLGRQQVVADDGSAGPQQGINDSHQRQMEQHSDAWGLLEQPVGRRDRHSGTDVHVEPAVQQGNRQSATQDPAAAREGTGMAIGPHSKQEKP